MDVGQIIGMTTESIRRDPPSRAKDTEEFSKFLTDPAPTDERRAKGDDDDARHVDARADLPGYHEKTDPNSIPPRDKGSDTPSLAERVDIAQDSTAVSQNTSTANKETADPVASGPPASQQDTTVAGQSGKADTAFQSASGAAAAIGLAATASPGQTQQVATAANEAAKVKSSVLTMDVATKEATTEAASKIAQGAAQQPEKTAKAAALKSETGAAATPAIAAENANAGLKTEAAAKTDKDILSAKVAEMLHEGKGKINLVSTAPKQTFQSVLASSTNLVSASLTSGATPAANGTLLTGAPLPDALGGQTPTTPGTAAQPVAADGLTHALSGAHTGAIQGVDATAASTAAQATNAARMGGQLPVADQVSTHFSAAAKEGIDHIKINLHPSELGRVDVKLEIGHDGRVIATVSVDKQHTLDMLQRDARTLERSLQDAGFQTGSNSLNFGLRQEGHNQHPRFANADLPIPDMAELDSPQVSNMPVPRSSSASNSNLDIQV